MKTNLKKIWDQASFGFARRLAVVFGALVAVFVALLLVINIQTQIEQVETRVELRADHLASLTTEISLPYVLENNPIRLEIIYEELARQGDIDSVSLFDDQGWLIVSAADDAGFLMQTQDSLVLRAQASGERQHLRSEKQLQIAQPLNVGGRTIGVIRIDICSDAFNAAMQTVWVRNISGGLAIIFFGILGSFLIANCLTRPLNQLTQATKRATKGDLDHRLCLKTNDEMGELATSFNTMMDTLQNSLREIHRVAYEDKLTGIPNRSWLNTQLERLTRTQAGKHKPFAVLFLDLDNFKAANDTHGHHIGDLLLKAFATRLSSCLMQHDLSVMKVQGDDSRTVCIVENEAILGRLGGDEFTIILPHEKAQAVAQTIIDAMKRPFNLEGLKIVTSSSIGIALYPDHARSREHLLKCADVAMYQAKHAGRDRFAVYDHSSHERLTAQTQLEKDIAKAIETDEFELYLQPQLRVGSNDVAGAEGLIRWNHRDKGMITPDTFLPVATQAGLLPGIGALMTRKAIMAAAQINQGRQKPILIAVNVAIEELNQEGFADHIIAMLGRYGADPKTLEIEITEGTAMEENGLIERQVHQLRAIGVRFAIDDFGIGYSNLARLKALSFETLKVDRSLMAGIGDDLASQSLLNTILEMADAIGADVVAEGIETQTQLDFLQQTSCEFYQGYFCGKPMPADAFARWLKAHEDEETGVVHARAA